MDNNDLWRQPHDDTGDTDGYEGVCDVRSSFNVKNDDDDDG